MHRRRHYIYPDPYSLVSAFVCEVSKFLEVSAELERPVHIALSGGSTPLAIFVHLAEATSKKHWSMIHFYWGDERCVGPDHIQSNYGNAHKNLISPLNLPDQQVHRIRGEDDPAAEAQRYGELLKEKLPEENGKPVFDWIWLGLGEDGHTASIFPDQLKQWNAEEICVVTSHPETGQKRISLTGSIINAARRVSFLATGGGKSKVINDIVMKEGNYLDYPAFYVAPHSEDLEWFLDKDATSWL